MALQLNTNITSASTTEPTALSHSSPGVAAAARTPEAPEAADGIGISIASTALNQLSADRSEKISRVTSEVQGGSYQPSSTATSTALVQHALSR